MSRIKLTYFDFDGGRAEPTRLALSIAGIAFEDERLSFQQISHEPLFRQTGRSLSR